MTYVVDAPWSAEQVAALERRQQVGHPYTCKAHSTVALVPTRDGWVCSLGGCGYRQAWAHGDDAKPERWAGCGYGDTPAAVYCPDCRFADDCRWKEHGMTPTARSPVSGEPRTEFDDRPCTSECCDAQRVRHVHEGTHEGHVGDGKWCIDCDVIVGQPGENVSAEPPVSGEPSTEAFDLIRDLVQHWDAGDIDNDYDGISGAFDSARDYVHRHGILAGEHHHPARATPPSLDADELAQIIRQEDGNHSLGAGALAERIIARLTSKEDRP